MPFPDEMAMNFASDNVMGASAPVLEAIVRANDGAAPAYGADAVTHRTQDLFRRIFEKEDLAVFPVATGTAANALALAALVPPYGLCVCHEAAHIVEEECGAPEFFTGGAKLAGLPGAGAKLDPGEVARFIDGLPANPKQMPPGAVSISQASECGLVYRPEEVSAIAEVAHGRGLTVHMDGARFANALVALGAAPADMTWRRGVDILSFGATKNGCWAAEAVVVFDPALAHSLPYRRKRAGHLLSKARFVAAQLEAYLDGGHWLANAAHANAMARRLSEGLATRAGVRLAWPVEANEVFAVLPRRLDTALRAAGAIYSPWSSRSLGHGDRLGPDEVLVRLVTSFATSEDLVERFLAAAAVSARATAAE